MLTGSHNFFIDVIFTGSPSTKVCGSGVADNCKYLLELEYIASFFPVWHSMPFADLEWSRGSRPPLPRKCSLAIPVQIS